MPVNVNILDAHSADHDKLHRIILPKTKLNRKNKNTIMYLIFIALPRRRFNPDRKKHWSNQSKHFLGFKRMFYKKTSEQRWNNFG